MSTEHYDVIIKRIAPLSGAILLGFENSYNFSGRINHSLIFTSG